MDNKNDLNSRISEKENELIKLISERIADNVDYYDINNKLNNMSGEVTSASQAAKELSGKISDMQNAIDSINIEDIRAACTEMNSITSEINKAMENASAALNRNSIAQQQFTETVRADLAEWHKTKDNINIAAGNAERANSALTAGLSAVNAQLARLEQMSQSLSSSLSVIEEQAKNETFAKFETQLAAAHEDINAVSRRVDKLSKESEQRISKGNMLSAASIVIGCIIIALQVLGFFIK